LAFIGSSIFTDKLRLVNLNGSKSMSLESVRSLFVLISLLNLTRCSLTSQTRITPRYSRLKLLVNEWLSGVTWPTTMPYGTSSGDFSSLVGFNSTASFKHTHTGKWVCRFHKSIPITRGEILSQRVTFKNRP